jgi:HD-like signal output (HDOD) protein
MDHAALNLEEVGGSDRPIADRLLEAVAKGKAALPPLPELGTRLRDMIADEGAGAPEVARLVGQDPAIAASLLRAANSAAFGGLRRISELDQAVARLGLKQVCSIVTVLLHKGMFASSSPERDFLFRTLWEHAVATSLGARHLAAKDGADPESALLAGLLHDTGKLLVLRGVDYLESSRQIPPAGPALLAELMEVLHTSLGYRVLKEWRIPEPICQVALHHHDADLSGADGLLLRVMAANAISRKLGAHPDPNPELRLQEVPAIERLGLGDLELATIQVDLEDALEQARELFLRPDS